MAYTERGSITIAFARGELAVIDTGCGIAELDLPHILSRFYRGRSVRERREGSGLGLAIVKRVADRFGWSLHVPSQMGEGSTFALRFPPSLQILQSDPASSQFSPASRRCHPEQSEGLLSDEILRFPDSSLRSE